MKKHDEGYALVLVLVVMIVISLVAATVLTFSLRNLQNQQKSIQRMEDKYEAQGLIEEVVAKLKTGTNITVDDLRATHASCVPESDAENEKNLVITAEHGTAKIIAKIELTISSGNIHGTFQISSLKYISYEITYTEATNNEGGALE